MKKKVYRELYGEKEELPKKIIEKLVKNAIVFENQKEKVEKFVEEVKEKKTGRKKKND